MVKRIIIKKGDLLCTEVDGKFKVYFQYVADDWAQLNSYVIRVFKHHYPMDYEPNMDEIVADDVEFYAHVYGLHNAAREGKLYKVGKHPDVGDTENIWFRCFSEGNINHMTKSYRWYVWKINVDHTIHIGELTSEYKHFDIGLIFPFRNVYDRIRTGKWQIKLVD